MQDNRHLASFTLKGIPPLPAGAAKVEVTFMIDADGILHVSALETHTGIAQQIEVKPSYGLTDEEIERMLRESIIHAKEDIAARRLGEAKTEGERVANATEKVLGDIRRGTIILSKESLGALKIDQIIDSLYALRKAISTDDAKEIIALTETLEQRTEPMAHEILNASVSQALSGKAIEHA